MTTAEILRSNALDLIRAAKMAARAGDHETAKGFDQAWEMTMRHIAKLEAEQ